MKGMRSLAAYLVLVVGGGLTIGYVTSPDDWYARLNKPSFTPPGWLFGPVWTLLYICIGFAGWRISGWWPKARSKLATRLWWAQLELNFLWSPLFFGLYLPGAALVVLILLLAAIVALIVVSWTSDRIVAWLNVPYVIWVAFAGVLNASIVALN
jgi:translocator protein